MRIITVLLHQFGVILLFDWFKINLARLEHFKLVSIVNVCLLAKREPRNENWTPVSTAYLLLKLLEHIFPFAFQENYAACPELPLQLTPQTIWLKLGKRAEVQTITVHIFVQESSYEGTRLQQEVSPAWPAPLGSSKARTGAQIITHSFPHLKYNFSQSMLKLPSLSPPPA